jgi:hypothetical protein
MKEENDNFFSEKNNLLQPHLLPPCVLQIEAKGKLIERIVVLTFSYFLF